MRDIRNLATGKNPGAWSHYSNVFTKAKVRRHNAMLFETATRIYIVGIIHPEQDAAAKLVDEEQLLKGLGQQDYTTRLERLRKIMEAGGVGSQKEKRVGDNTKRKTDLRITSKERFAVISKIICLHCSFIQHGFWGIFIQTAGAVLSFSRCSRCSLTSSMVYVRPSSASCTP